MKIIPAFLLFLFVLLTTSCSDTPNKVSGKNYLNWDTYLGDQDRSHYSSLDQINDQNVKNLEVAWTYHTGDGDKESYIQCNPLIIGNILYASSPKLKVFALDATTGKELWSYNPFEGTDNKDFARGLLYFENKIYFTADKYLHCLRAENGQLVSTFGDNGKLDLTKGLDRDISGLTYRYHAPPTRYKNLLIMGSLTAETLPAAPGHIRAFDIHTGEQKWIFHTIPHPGEYGYETWQDSTAYRFIGGANNWTGLTIDEGRGIAFVPTGSASYDFYGANRKGENLFANCLIALDANTGKRIWHFQGVHHDIWDRDFPSPPTLVKVAKEGQSVDAVAQITKSGHVYVFNRETGESLFPIEEKAYDASTLPGEETWVTQPLPLSPSPFSKQTFTEADLNPYSTDQEDLVTRFRGFKSGGQFIPPSLQGTLLYPGLDGGGEWGGAGYDPTTGWLYVNANEMAWVIKMIEVGGLSSDNPIIKGRAIYQTYCMNCHGNEFQGSTFHGNVPALVEIEKRMTTEAIEEKIVKGKGSMPQFSFLTSEEVSHVTSFISDQNSGISSPTSSEEGELQYRMAGYQRFLDSEGYPGVKPPWGTLNAINLNKGTIEWKVPLGEFDELTAKGIPKTGTENYGGMVLTAGNLIFIGATSDGYFRAFNKTTGEEIWKYKLPAPGLATPATYQVNGIQYVVIAAAGGKDTKQKGDAYVAFKLPKQLMMK